MKYRNSFNKNKYTQGKATIRQLKYTRLKFDICFKAVYNKAMEGTDYQIIFFVKTNGRAPVRDYIESQDKKTQQKVLAYLDNLALYEEFRRVPYSKNIEDKIKELRINTRGKFIRIFYFILAEKNIILLHAFSKKSKKLPKKEIEIAKNRKNEFLNQLSK